tara:strand:- start:674 stop:1093 length:420 start_codon:yes stop_codon:yes gene_type:complete
MKQSVYLFLLFFLLSYNVVNASEKISLMSLNDLNIIFSTNAQTWNENLVFLDKKSSMKKLQLENNKHYSLKSTFKNGYVLITPYFKKDLVETLNINYNFNDIDQNTIDLIFKHFESLDLNFCNSLKTYKNDIIIDIKYC